MSKICCSTEKARVYYQIPSPGGLKIRLKGETKWTTLSAPEKLTSSCKLITQKDVRYMVSCGVDGFTCNPSCIGPITWIGNNQIMTGGGIFDFQGAAVGRNCDGNIVIRRDSPPGNDPFQFKVTGAETGNTYLDITVDECPDVQEMSCQWGKEQHIDIELISMDVDGLRWLPGFGSIPLPFIFRDCVEIVTQENAIQIRKVGEAGFNNPISGEIVWVPTLLNQPLKQVDSPQGCPAPKARIECAPGYGIPPGEDKKCPKETDCTRDCGGYRCCYYKGKLIKTIKL